MIIKDIAQFIQEIKNIHKCKLMGIDYGLKKTGLALTCNNLLISMPLDIIVESNIEKLIDKIFIMIARYEVKAIVCGHSVGYANEMLENFLQSFCKRLNSQSLNLPIFLEDEFYTSKTANEMLKDLGQSRKKRNKIDDKVAASLILQNFIEKLNLYTPAK